MTASPQPSLNRRRFLLGTAVGAAASLLPRAATFAAGQSAPGALPDRVRGLVLGSALGDALGGPIEFQPRERVQSLVDPPKVWLSGEKLDAPARVAAARRLRLRSYRELRPGTESYGQWNPGSEAGTITDDTRHKLVLLEALRQAERTEAWPLEVRALAQAYLDWPQTGSVVGRPGYEALAKDWLEEWQFAARWVLGERDLSRARPPERMWQSLPTCCGQMTSLPLAALFPGEPERAYRAAYGLGFFDNGFGKDLNAALVAGLAAALVTPVTAGNHRPAYETVIKTMRETDPLRFREIRWSERAVDRWLDLALRLARDAANEPARLFAALEGEFASTTKWEAQVPFVVTFACLELADYDPLAALQLSLEWGHDSDSYAQLVGAFIGALHGASLFPASWCATVVTRLQADHGIELEAESRFLERLAELGGRRTLIAGL